MATRRVSSRCRPRGLATDEWTSLNHRPVRPTLEQFEAHDGLELSGWLYRARDGQPGPVVLSLHGGPEAQERPTWQPLYQLLVDARISVFAPNVRGSSGFGRNFIHADDGYGRYAGIADVASCVRYLQHAGIAAEGQIACSGRSYGGYLTLIALARYPYLFASGVDICGMSDFATFFRDTEPWIASSAMSKYGHPIRDAALLADLSPMNHLDTLEAPLLVVHGEFDTNVPIGEADQLVAALRARRRTVEYLVLEGEGHEYRRLDSRLLLAEQMVAFLQRTLGVS